MERDKDPEDKQKVMNKYFIMSLKVRKSREKRCEQHVNLFGNDSKCSTEAFKAECEVSRCWFPSVVIIRSCTKSLTKYQDFKIFYFESNDVHVDMKGEDSNIDVCIFDFQKVNRATSTAHLIPECKVSRVSPLFIGGLFIFI